MISLHNILSYIRWWLQARDRQGHRVHSTFLYSLIANELHKPMNADKQKIIADYRHQLLTDKTLLTITDLGSGSRYGNDNQRRVCDIVRHSSTSARDGRLLCNLATAMHCQNILELGTNLGLGTLYLAKSEYCRQIVTIEGCPNLSALADNGFKQLGISNITIINKEFSEALPQALKMLPTLDFLFIDGNHNGNATIGYFTQCLPFAGNDTVFVIDDIHKDAGMESAWAEIIANQKVTLSLDFFTMGVLFFRRQLSKQNICLHY